MFVHNNISTAQVYKINLLHLVKYTKCQDIFQVKIMGRNATCTLRYGRNYVYV